MIFVPNIAATLRDVRNATARIQEWSQHARYPVNLGHVMREVSGWVVLCDDSYMDYKDDLSVLKFALVVHAHFARYVLKRISLASMGGVATNPYTEAVADFPAFIERASVLLPDQYAIVTDEFGLIAQGAPALRGGAVGQAFGRRRRPRRRSAASSSFGKSRRRRSSVRKNHRQSKALRRR